MPLNRAVFSRLVLVVSALSMGGCATYSSSFRPIEQEIVANNPEKALKLLEKQKLSGKDALLHLLNKAMLLRMMGKYQESNQHFELAKKQIDRYSAVSVTEQITSFLVNDSSQAFIGDPFEQVLIHLYSALNYLQLGEVDSARVEALQVDTQLRKLSTEKKNALLNSDPFSRYLSGIIYEDLREWSNALISYRKAYQAYQGHSKFYSVSIPASLKQDLVRLTDYEGLKTEHNKFKKEFGITDWQKQQSLNKMGEVILVVDNGLAPIKREHTVARAGIDGQIHRISLPYYQLRKNGLAHASIKPAGQNSHRKSALVEDINHIAEKTLAENMPKIILRTLGRAVAKHKTAKKAGEKDALVGFLVNIANVATEVADTRSWLTLPGEIHLARLPLKPGTYDLELELVSHSGHTLSRHQFKQVEIKRGRKTYLSHHWVSPSAIRRK